MTARARSRPESPAKRLAEVSCRRVECTRGVSEHLSCPYCFGDAASVASAEHERFCDYRPGQDPIVFGFPQDVGRYRSR